MRKIMMGLIVATVFISAFSVKPVFAQDEFVFSDDSFFSSFFGFFGGGSSVSVVATQEFSGQLGYGTIENFAMLQAHETGAINLPSASSSDISVALAEVSRDMSQQDAINGVNDLKTDAVSELLPNQIECLPRSVIGNSLEKNVINMTGVQQGNHVINNNGVIEITK